MNYTEYGNIAVGAPNSLERHKHNEEWLLECRNKLASVMCQMAYPRRGTDDESMDLYQYAELFQKTLRDCKIDYHDVHYPSKTYSGHEAVK